MSLPLLMEEGLRGKNLCIAFCDWLCVSQAIAHRFKSYACMHSTNDYKHKTHFRWKLASYTSSEHMCDEKEMSMSIVSTR